MGNNENEINKSDFFPTLTKSILKKLQDMLHSNNEKNQEYKIRFRKK